MSETSRRRFLLLSVAMSFAIAIAGCSQRAAGTVAWGVFLDNIGRGQVAKIVQEGTTMTVTAVDGEVYTVTAPGNPNVNADYRQVFEIAGAASGHGNVFNQSQYSVVPVQDNSWIGLVLVGLLPVLFGGVLVFVLTRQARRMQLRDVGAPQASAPTLVERLRQLEDARSARLLTDEEYAARRAKIIDET